MRTGTATRAATRSATSAGRSICTVPNLQALGLGNIRPLRGVPPPRRRAASYGRMAEASPGKDSVTGHWEIAGVVLDRPFPTFPQGFPPEVIDAFEREIGRGDAGQRGRVGHRDHRAARRRARGLGQAHRLHLGRQRLPDCRARRRRARARALPDVRGGLSPRRGRHGRRARDRAAVRRAVRRVHAHGEPARLRDAVAATDVARSACRLPASRSSPSARSRTSSRAVASPSEAAHAVR